MNLNHQQMEVVKSFAKQQKWSVAKLSALAADIVAASGHKAPGRTASSKSVDLRNKLADLRTSRQGQSFTVSDLAKELDTDHVSLNNSLRYMAKREKLVAIAGRVDKQPGKKGPRAIIWKFN